MATRPHETTPSLNVVAPLLVPPSTSGTLSEPTRIPTPEARREFRPHDLFFHHRKDSLIVFNIFQVKTLQPTFSRASDMPLIRPLQRHFNVYETHVSFRSSQREHPHLSSCRIACRRVLSYFWRFVFFDALNLELCMELPASSTTTPQQSPPAQHQNHSTTATAKTTSPAP